MSPADPLVPFIYQLFRLVLRRVVPLVILIPIIAATVRWGTGRASHRLARRLRAWKNPVTVPTAVTMPVATVPHCPADGQAWRMGWAELSGMPRLSVVPGNAASKMEYAD